MAAQERLTARPGPPTDARDKPAAGAHPLDLDPGCRALLYLPPGHGSSRPVPLVVLLHGAGGDAGQLLPLMTPLADAHSLLLLAPSARGRSWDVILGSYGADVRCIDRALGQVFARHAIDPRHLAIGGFSDGASYALSLGLTNGDLFSHILAFSPGFMAPSAFEAGPRLFVAHGTADPVLPIARTSRRLVPRLRAAGYRLEYREFEGGHLVPPGIAAEAVAWFLHG